MKLIKNQAALFCLLLTLIACKGQNGTNPLTSAAKDSTREASKPGGTGDLQDFDPYFTETKAITSQFGPGNIVRNIIQDKNGYYWIASWEGIIRYDGTAFTNFTNQEHLRRYHVFAVMEDKDGNLWFGTIGAGVYRYDGKKFTNFTQKDGLADDNIGCIYQDHSGAIWIGTFAGASRYADNKFVNYNANEGMDVNSVIEDKNGKIWAAAREGLFAFDGKSFIVVKNDEGQPFVNVRTIIEDKKGNLWLGGQDGLHRYNWKHFETFSTDFVGFLYEGKKGDIWMSSSAHQSDMALSKFEENTLTNFAPKAVKIKQEKGMVFGITEDNNGHIWYGTGHGICRFDGKDFTCFSEEEAGK